MHVAMDDIKRVRVVEVRTLRASWFTIVRLHVFSAYGA